MNLLLGKELKFGIQDLDSGLQLWTVPFHLFKVNILGYCCFFVKKDMIGLKNRENAGFSIY